LILSNICILANFKLINNLSNNKGNPLTDVELFDIRTNLADDWEYYREITINPTTPEADYQIKILLNSSNFDYSKASSNGSDLRFYNQDETMLNYWIENWDTSGDSLVWVKIPDSGTSTIFMYYGNPAATTLSNGTNTFTFFDDFEGTSLNLSKWNQHLVSRSGTFSVTVSNSIVRILMNFGGSDMRQSWNSFGWHDYYTTGGGYGTVTPNGIAVWGDYTRTENETGTTQSTPAGTVKASEWEWYSLDFHYVNSSVINFYENDTLIATHTDTNSFPASESIPIKLMNRAWDYPNGNHYMNSIRSNEDLNKKGTALRMLVRLEQDLAVDNNEIKIEADWIFIHECHEIEPTISISSEEINQLNENKPVLSAGLVSPLIGDQITEFTFSVNYTDLDNNEPEFVDVIVNGSTFMMSKLNDSDYNYTDGCIYKYSTYLIPSIYNYTYMFNCSDREYYNSTMTFNDLKVIKTNNFKPQLLYPQVSPENGTDITDFNFTVWYFDDDNNLPTHINVTINQTTYLMEKQDPIDTNATNGIIFYFNTTLDFGYYQFQFNCSDGKFKNSTSWISNPEVNPFFYGDDITLISPINGSSLFTDWISFEWSSLAASFGNVSYTLQISNNSDFSSLVFELADIEEEPGITSVDINLIFDSGIYFWRISPKFENFTGNWSEPFKFSLFANYLPPSLNFGAVTPTIGDQYTVFNFTVSYFDQDNNLPLSLNVIINGSSFAMDKVNSLDIDYTDGCLFQYLTTLPVSSHNFTYSFNCNDGKYSNSSMSFNNLEVNSANYFAPQLQNLQVSPVYGGLTTIFEFSVWYFDEDNNLPTYVNITLDNTDFSMIQYNPSDSNAMDGILFYFNTTLNYGFHSFQVSCSDGKFTNSTELIIGPEVNPLYGVPPITLLNPIYDADLPAGWINFSWISLNATFGTVNYSIQISNRLNFSTILYENFNISETPNISEIQLDIDLPTGIYYWRVRPTFGIFNGDWSNNFKLNIIRNDFAPILISNTIFPLSGNQITIFKFTAIYQDLDNNAPMFIRIIINGIPYVMEKQNPNDIDYTDGCTYQFLTLLTPSEEAYTFSLECYDGVFYNITSTYEGPIVSNDAPIYDRNAGLRNRDSENMISLSVSLVIGLGIIVPSIVLTHRKSKKIKSKSITKSKDGLGAKKSISKKYK
jgi:hypothetical protein